MKNQYTETFPYKQLDAVFIENMESICRSISLTGLDPYSQLTGYLLTGEDCYITRTGNARSIIATLDNTHIRAYVKMYLEK